MDQPLEQSDEAARLFPGEQTIPSEQTVFRLLARIGMALNVAVQPSDVVTSREANLEGTTDPLAWLTASATHAGILIRQVEFEDIKDAIAFVQEGYPLIVSRDDGTFVLIDAVVGRDFEATTISEHVTSGTIHRRQLIKLVMADDVRVFVAKKDLECDPLSSSPALDADREQREC